MNLPLTDKQADLLFRMIDKYVDAAHETAGWDRRDLGMAMRIRARLLSARSNENKRKQLVTDEHRRTIREFLVDRRVGEARQLLFKLAHKARAAGRLVSSYVSLGTPGYDELLRLDALAVTAEEYLVRTARPEDILRTTDKET